MNPAPRQLCPGYTHVESFGPDSDYESDEDVEYVTLDLGTVEPALLPSSSSYMLIGLDTPTPFLQLSGTTFKGQHDSLLGTELLLSDSTSQQDCDRNMVRHIASTEQRIQFRPVQLVPKTTTSEEKEQEMSVLAVPQSKKKAIPTIDQMTGREPIIMRTRNNNTTIRDDASAGEVDATGEVVSDMSGEENKLRSERKRARMSSGDLAKDVMEIDDPPAS